MLVIDQGTSGADVAVMFSAVSIGTLAGRLC